MRFPKKWGAGRWRGPVLLATTLLADVSATRAHGQENDYYSQNLGARFTIQQVTVPGYATVWSALLTSQPSENSPLLGAALQQGDMITRLDGKLVTTYAELDNHFDWTTVRYLRQGQYLPQDCQTSIFIIRSEVEGESGGTPP